MRTLLFDQEKQTYTVDGNVVPRVTQIVAAVTGKDMLKIPPKVLEAARARGDAIHKDVEEGTFQTVEGQWIKAQLRGPAKHEVKGTGIVNGLLFAGTCDILYDGDLGIDDTKTQAERDILGWTIQLNLYRKIFKSSGALRVLHVPKSGDFHVVPIATLSDEKMEEVISAYNEGRVLDASFLSVIEKPQGESLELVVYKNTVGELTTNAKMILESVKRNLAGYNAENYSEANIADAKRDKAELNAAAKKLNDKRLELEREFMKPFNEFKDTVAETCTVIKTVSAQIDAVVKAVEEREKAEKEKLLTGSWDALGFTLVPLSKVWNPAWLNKTAKNKDTVAEMARIIDKIKQDLVVLDRIGEPDAKAHYLDTLNLDAALQEADRIKVNRDRLATIERERKEAEALVPQAEPEFETGYSEPEATEESRPVNPQDESTPFEQEPEPTPEPEMLERTMWVRGTYEQIVALGDFMNDHGIEFRKL